MGSRRGVLALVVLLTLVGAVVLFAAIRLSRPLHAPGRHQMLVLDVPATIEEAPPTYGGFSLGSLRPDRPTIHDLASTIRHAADDDDVKGLVLHIGGMAWGWGHLAELRDAIAEFPRAHKPVYASLEGGSEPEYLLASAASVVAMPPTSTLQLDGLEVNAMFLKGTYDKLGISPNFAHVGQFKSAAEQYTRTDLSPASRVALEALLDDEYTLLTDSLGTARHVSPDSMRRLIDAGPYTASGARSAGLIDTLLDESDVDTLAAGRGGHPLELVNLTHYADRDLPSPGAAHVALLVADGAIIDGKSRENPWQGREMGSETIVGALREAGERRSVRAIVLRVDSPGGSGTASDAIWREVRRVRRVKPVIVSMADYGASGGYYIACGADVIVAEPGTITGSIGVFGGKLNLLGLYQKLGLSIDTVSRGKHAQMMSPFRDFSPEEAQIFQSQLNEFYRGFLSRVAEGRHMTTANVDSLAQGRVWSGLAARRLGLVDSLGGLDVAVEVARKRAHIGADEDIVLDAYPRQRRTYFQHLLSGLFDNNEDDSRALLLSPVLSAWLTAARFPTGEVLAMLPYTIEIR